MWNITPFSFTVFKNITTHLSHVTTSLPWGHVLKANDMDVYMTIWMLCKHVKTFFLPFACLIQCWTLFLATIWRMAKYILKTTQTFGSKIKHWHLMQWHTTVTGVKFRRKRKSVLHYVVCRCWSWNISTHITFDRGIFWSL